MKFIKTIATIITLSAFALTAQAATLIKAEPVAKEDLVKIAKVNLQASMTVATDHLFAKKVNVQAPFSSKVKTNKQQTISFVNYAD